MADLTTATAVKAYGSISGAELDALLALLVTRASAMVEAYLCRVVKEATHTETRDGNGGAAMLLRQHPVSSVSAVTINGAEIPAATTFDGPGWRLAGRVVTLNGYRFARGIGNVVVTYVAGYAAVPPDIEQACIEAVLLALKRRDHIDVSSKSLAGETISYLTAELPPSARQALAPHRNVAPLP